MLAFSAHPSSAISRPQNGTTGQKPRLTMRPQTKQETKHRPRKNRVAPRTSSEQFGAMTMIFIASANL